MSIKREFVINRQGKDMALYPGLLDEAHAQGLNGITTQLVQIPHPDNGNVAIVFATVTTAKGSFTGIGDASPDNVSRAMVNAIIRLAETRAKARAMRDAINLSEALADDPADPTEDERDQADRIVDRRTGEIRREPTPIRPAKAQLSLEDRAANAATYMAQHADEAALTGYDVVSLPENATPAQVIEEATRMKAHIDNAPKMLK